MKKIYSLEFKVFAALAGFAVVAVSVLGFMTYALDEGRANQQIFSRLSQLDTLSSGLFRRSDRYVQVAPRDFPDYNRDVTVFYPEFIADLNNMGKLIEEVGRDYYSRKPARIIGGLGIGLRTTALDTSMQTMTTEWQTFFSGLKEQLGDNDAEPRLEWGTIHIREHQGRIRMLVNDLISEMQTNLEQQTKRMQNASYLAMVLLGLMVLAGLVWFYFGVTLRIKQAVAGCVRVSTGDFGYQMKVGSRDEIGTLSGAINNLSMRARLVLSLIDKVRVARNQKAALQHIWDESNPLFELTWLGLYRFDDDLEHMTLLKALPKVWATNWNRQDIRRQDGPNQVMQSREPLVIRDMGEYTKANPTERMVRNLTRKVADSRSALMLPLVAGDDAWGMLIMVSSSGDAFQQENVKLLESLVPILSDAFTRAEVDAPDTQPDNRMADQQVQMVN